MYNLSLKISAVLLFILTIGMPHESTAQAHSSSPLIIPGSTELQLQKIKPYEHTFELYLVAGEEEALIGTLNESVRVLRNEGVIERVQRLSRPNQPEHVDSLRASLHSLIPLSHSSSNASREITLHFDSLKVEGSFDEADTEPLEFGQNFDHPYFDSNWTDLVIRLLPLKPGYKRTIRTFEVVPDGSPGFVPYHLEVSRQEAIQTANKTSKKVWVINQIKENRTTTFYVEVQSRELLRLEVPISDTQKMVMRRAS